MSSENRGNIFCPKCAIPTQVIDTRGTSENEVRRRRRCSDCGQRFTTYETIHTPGERDKERRKEAREIMRKLSVLLGLEY
jgi:transcriptional regulator NrdR family protein